MVYLRECLASIAVFLHLLVVKCELSCFDNDSKFYDLKTVYFSDIKINQ